MTPLLEALQAAQEVGFDAPKCQASYCWDGESCPSCGLTGLDASDPERLLGRAMAWLLTRNHVPAYMTFRVGKHAAGRELDGKVWDGYPAEVHA